MQPKVFYRPKAHNEEERSTNQVVVEAEMGEMWIGSIRKKVLELSSFSASLWDKMLLIW